MNRFALAALVAAILSTRAEAQDDPIETHVYNIEFLTRTVQDWPGVDFSLAQDAIGTLVSASEMASTRISGADIASLMKNNIAEDTWDRG
jgi:hypothetical protein